MKLFGRDLDQEVAVVAELGVNHEGDVDWASRMIVAAADAGADAVKLQSYTPWRYASAADPDRLARVTRFALDLEAHQRLAAEARDLGVHLFSTPVTEDWVPDLAELFGAIKVASADLTFEPVVRAAAATGCPVLLSTGLATPEEIATTLGWFRDESGLDDLSDRVVLLHCVVAYPTPLAEANVAVVPWLAQTFGVPAGWSNHILSPAACYAAVALGASVVEVHVTDRREGKAFHDHALSFEPAELADLVVRCREIRTAVGVPDKRRQPSELPLLEVVRKGVIAAVDLPAGTVLADADLAYARPATEFAASERATLVGATLNRAVGRGELIPREAVVR